MCVDGCGIKTGTQTKLTHPKFRVKARKGKAKSTNAKKKHGQRENEKTLNTR